VTGEELIRQIVIQAKDERYGRDHGWIVVRLPVSERDLSQYIKEAGGRGLLKVAEVTNFDSEFEEWKIVNITASGLQFLEEKNASRADFDIKPTEETERQPQPDKSAKLYFWTGLFVALVAVGLPLIGVTVNVWLGGALLAIAFFSIIRAFWIWEKSSRFHILLRVGTIGVAAILYFGLAGRQIVNQYKSDHLTKNRSPLTANTKTESTAPLIPVEKPAKKASHVNAAIPPLRGSDEFLTYVMIDSNKKVFCTNKMPQVRLESCNEIHTVFERMPKNENVVSALASVLQHDLVAIIFAAGQRWGMYGAGDRAFIHDFVAPIEPPDGQTYTPHFVSQMPGSELFPDGLRFMWNEPRMKLPKATSLSLMQLPTENQGPVCNTVRLERKGYYRIDVCFKRYQEIALLPKEYEQTEAGQINTYAFEVIVDWTVERSHDASFAVEDYDRWARQLAGRIRDRLLF
jgi:hypothetical protein